MVAADLGGRAYRLGHIASRVSLKAAYGTPPRTDVMMSAPSSRGMQGLHEGILMMEATTAPTRGRQRAVGDCLAGWHGGAMAHGGDERQAGSVSVDLAGELAGAAVPGLGTITKVLATGLLREWGRNRSVALRAAEHASRMTREEIGEAITQDPRLVPLATRLLHAAGMNGHDRVLTAMGVVFGAAIRQRESLDECELILSSLADLTDIHAELLLLAGRRVPRPEGASEGLGWSLEDLQRDSGLPERLTALGVSGLTARGLLRMRSDFFGGLFYSSSELGAVLLEVLEQYAAAVAE
jgi:hypothetical protein